MFIASLTQFSDQAGLVKLFYPEKSDFILALISGIGAVMIYGLVISERKRSPIWIQPVFRHFISMMWLLLVLDAIILGQRLVHDYFIFKISYALDGLILFWSALYLANSKRLKYYAKDWHKEEVLETHSVPDEVSVDHGTDQSLASISPKISKRTAANAPSELEQLQAHDKDNKKRQ